MSQSSTEIRSDMLAPHSIEAEEAVLGSILLNPEAFILAMFLSFEDWFLVRHGWIWNAMVTINRRHDPIDHLTVVEELETNGHLAEVGGAAYVISLINKTPSALNVAGYAAIVHRMSIRRRMIEAAQVIARVAHSDETDIDEVITQAQRALAQVTKGYGRKRALVIGEIASEHFDTTGAAIANGSPVRGLPTGLVDLDRITGGLRKGDLDIVAARPGMGKTSFLLGIVKHVAKQGKAVGFLSFEQSARSLTTRLLTAECGIPYNDLDDGRVREDQMPAYVQAIGTVGEWPIIFQDDTSLRNVYKACNAARQMWLDFGIELLVVDYLQLMIAPSGHDKRVENRNQEIAIITGELKSLARELDIPVFVACQLNRAVEGRSDKRPMLSDLRDSGSIEQDIDLGMFIYRAEYYDHNAEEGHRSEIDIPKNRNGQTGTIDVIWFGETMQFKDAAPVWASQTTQSRKQSSKQPTTPATFVAGRDDPGTPLLDLNNGDK